MRMYFIAVLLPEILNKQVLVLKEYMREHYGCKVALRSPAHITIVPPFWMGEALQDQLVESLDEIAGRLTAFQVQQEGFSSFPPKTIFISSAPNSFLEELHRIVNDHFHSQPAFPMKFDDRPFHPHVTIATRDLTKRTFQEAWEHFKEKRFKKEWKCSSISLLRLSEEGWQVLHSSSLGKGS